MSESKYIIHDVVETSHRGSQQRSTKSINASFSNFLKKLLIFLGIIGLSAAIGYFAVYLPDSVPKQKDATGIEGIPSDVNDLSDEQKQKIKEYMGK